MSRGKILLIVVPAAMALGVVIALLFLSSLGKDDDDSMPVVSSTPPASSSQYWTGATAGSTPMVPESSPVVQQSEQSQPPALQSEPEPASSQATGPQNVPTPGGFTEAPTIAVNGNTVSVTFKTATNSTVNSILVTSGDGLTVSGFYDYYNRGKEYAPAVEKKSTFNVGPDGVTETYTLPDTTKSYWLLINTVENESGAWQPEVTAVPIYTP